MSETKYVEQISTGRIYVSTPFLEKHPDFRPTRLNAPAEPKAIPETEPEDSRETEQMLAAVSQAAREIAQGETETVGASEAVTEEPAAETAVADKSLRAAIESATTKEEIEVIMLRNFDRDIDRRKSLQTLREEALALL